MRGWIDDRPNYLPPVGIGEVMRGMTLGEVVESDDPIYAVGDRVTSMSGWQEYTVPLFGLTKVPDGIDPLLSLSVLGMTGVTAYFGLLDIGRPEPGQTVVVSGAAGATGSVAGQIARLKGCRVVGIAGGPEKCSWLVDEAKFDAAIDYKSDDVGARLSELCPDGIDVFFDNVGGPVLDLVLERLALRGRIVVCGSITRFGTEAVPPGPKNYFYLTQQRGRMEGFVVLDYFDRMAEATDELAGWVAAGEIAYRHDVQQGFENAPRTLMRLYTGANQGKQLLEL